jgi:hypothetical protein
VTFRLTILETPIPGAPVLVNTDTKMTDSNGEFVASLENGTSYTVSTGLEAISFVPLFDTGGGFATQQPVQIVATRLISSAKDPCRVIVGGVPNIYFASVNLLDKSLTVPLEYTELNAMYSVTGEASPADLFAPGQSGFTVPEAYFKSGAVLTGVWRFLGQNINVPSSPDMCADSGVPGACEPLDPSTLRSPFEYTRKVIVKLTKLSLKAAQSGRWKGANGRFSVPFLARGAKSLATMEKVFRDSTGLNYVCETVPMSCETKRVPKALLLKAFSQIFTGQVPRGLENIAGLKPRELAAFERFLKKIPDRYTKCSQ